MTLLKNNNIVIFTIDFNKLSFIRYFKIGTSNINSTYNLKNHHSPLYDELQPTKFNINSLIFNSLLKNINPIGTNIINTIQ